MGWWISDFSKPVGQGGFGEHSKAKWVTQFLQTEYLGHKMSQNTTVWPVSYSSDCTLNRISEMLEPVSQKMICGAFSKKKL